MPCLDIAANQELKEARPKCPKKLGTRKKSCLSLPELKKQKSGLLPEIVFSVMSVDLRNTLRMLSDFGLGL